MKLNNKAACDEIEGHDLQALRKDRSERRETNNDRDYGRLGRFDVGERGSDSNER